MTRGLEEIKAGDIQEVGELGGTAVAKYSAAFSAMLCGKMSFDAQEERGTRDEHGDVQGR